MAGFHSPSYWVIESVYHIMVHWQIGKKTLIGQATRMLSLRAVPCSRKRLPLPRFPSQGPRSVIGSTLSSSDARRSYPHVHRSRLRI